MLVNMVQCIPRDSKSVTGNPYDNASWFMYSLKLAKYCGEHHTLVVVMCNNSYDPNLVDKVIQIVNSKAKRVEQPAIKSGNSGRQILPIQLNVPN